MDGPLLDGKLPFRYTCWAHPHGHPQQGSHAETAEYDLLSSLIPFALILFVSFWEWDRGERVQQKVKEMQPHVMWGGQCLAWIWPTGLISCILRMVAVASWSSVERTDSAGIGSSVGAICASLGPGRVSSLPEAWSPCSAQPWVISSLDWFMTQLHK